MATSKPHWFLRGALVGILVSAALNAASYFVRSDRGGNLLGNRRGNREALGFPLEMWEGGNSFDGYFVDLGPLAVNLTCGLVLGVFCGWLTLRARPWLDRLEQEVDLSLAQTPHRPPQISLRSLLLATTLVAILAAAARYALAGQRFVLALFYLFGPWILVTVPFLPSGLDWKRRVYLVIPVTLLLMAAGIAIGQSFPRPLDFDKVLLGTFICWTPQSVVAAIIIMTVLLRSWRRRGSVH